MDKQEFLKTVSENIKKDRAQYGLTQEKFAEKSRDQPAVLCRH